MTETEETEFTGYDLSTTDGWLEFLDLELGSEVMLIPVAGGGNGFQGVLVDLVCNTMGPAIFVIEKIGSPRVSVNWANCVMATRVVGPSGTKLTPVDLVEFADANGIDITDEVREGIAGLES